MKNLSYLFIAAVILLVSCGGGTEYVDPNKDQGSGTWGPYEIKKTTGLMVDSLFTYLKDTKASALLKVMRIKNRASEHIDTKMLSEQIATNLIKKQIQFIDDTLDNAALKEIKDGMTGKIDSDYAIPMGKLQSPNLYLYGEVSDNMRFVSGKQKQYIIVTLTLREVATRRVKWQEQKEFLKVSNTTKVGF